MSKAYLLVICLLTASFTGCMGGDDDDDDDVEITPNATNFEVPNWEFFYVGDPNLNAIRGGVTSFAVGVANYGDFPHNFTVRLPFVLGPDVHHILSLNFYSDNLSKAGDCTWGALQMCDAVNFTLESNINQIILIDIHTSEGANDTQFDLRTTTSGFNETGTQISSSKFLSFNVNVIDKGEGGKQVEIGNSTHSDYWILFSWLRKISSLLSRRLLRPSCYSIFLFHQLLCSFGE